MSVHLVHDGGSHCKILEESKVSSGASSFIEQFLSCLCLIRIIPPRKLTGPRYRFIIISSFTFPLFF